MPTEASVGWWSWLSRLTRLAMGITGWHFAVRCVSFVDVMDTPVVNRVRATLASAVAPDVAVHGQLLPPFSHSWQCTKGPSFILDPRCSFS